MVFSSKIFIFSENMLTTFIDQTKEIRWPKWKKFKELTEEEKKIFNLAYYPKNCLLLDKDFKNTTKKEIEDSYKEIIEKIKEKGIKNYLSWMSPHGFHILIAFKDMDSLSEEMKTEIKRIYVEEFKCDPSKISDKGVISIPERPHFKTMEVFNVREEVFNGLTPIPKGVLSVAMQNVVERKEKLSEQYAKVSMEFKDFFSKDPFFNYIKNNKIPEGTNRDLTLFPNLAIAAVQSGKSKLEIERILRPVIKENFPGKVYAEFEGWLKKAFEGKITEFNPYLINTWFKENCGISQMYDLTPISIDDSLKKLNPEEKEKSKRINLIWNNEVMNIAEGKVEWLVDGWIGKGDICMYVGKSNSYKTTSLMHMALCIANGTPVFNKYSVKKSKVLYINEENHRQLTKEIFKRVYNGLDIEESKNFALAQEENLKLDLDKSMAKSDLIELAEIVSENNIEVIILDTLRRFISFDENDATRMSLFFDRLKKLRKFCNYPTIIVLHHTKKTNKNYASDIRDEIRGSSDIVNNADTVIGLERNVGKNCFKISHIKSRGSIEQDKKLIAVDGKEDPENISYLYETSKADFAGDSSTKIEECAESILRFVEDSKENVFARKDISDALKDIFSDTIIFRSLKAMENDGTVIKQGSGRKSKWVFDPRKVEESEYD